MRNEIFLPNLSITYNFRLPADNLLMISGGRAPEVDWLRSVANCPIWCIDHGIDICREAGLVPERLIGDGDSAAADNWNWAIQQKIPIEKFQSEKDFTDTQLALDRAMAQDRYVILTGSLGGRLDHLMSTLFTFGYADVIGCLADEKECVIILNERQGATLSFDKSPKAISLLPLTDCTGVSIYGVHWPLKDVAVRQSQFYTISNELARDDNDKEITVQNGTGILGVYVCWSED